MHQSSPDRELYWTTWITSQLCPAHGLIVFVWTIPNYCYIYYKIQIPVNSIINHHYYFDIERTTATRTYNAVTADIDGWLLNLSDLDSIRFYLHLKLTFSCSSRFYFKRFCNLFISTMIFLLIFFTQLVL